MAKGILGGMFFGGAISVAAAGVISVVLDPPTRPEVVAETPDAVDAPAIAQGASERRFNDADLVRDATAPQVAAPQAEDAADVTAAGIDTPSVPETGGGDTSELVASDTPEQSGVTAASDEPVLPAPQAVIPAVPAAEQALAISTTPPEPPALPGQDAEEDVAIDLASPARPSAPSSDTPVSQAEAAPSKPPAPAVDNAVAVAEAPPLPTLPADPAEEVEVAALPDAPDAEADQPTKASEGADQVQEAPVAQEDSQIAAVDDGDTVPQTTETTKPANDSVASNGSTVIVSDGTTDIALQNDTVRTIVGRPAKSLIERDDAEDTEDPEVRSTPKGPPLTAFAAKFENPENKPLMSIILVDDGSDLSTGAAGLAALESFPFPLSFAVSVSMPDAQERMKAYRDAGYEVLAMMDLPPLSTAQDVEVNVLAAFDTIPEAVGLIEGTGSGLQESRPAAEQLVAALKESGHGFVLQAKGLNAVQKLAERDGVPSRVVFRDFDSAGQTARVIRRFLDQAAFRAGQEGGVVMMGRVRPDTISALLLWGFQDRAQRVALAPVSAVLSK